MTLSAHWSNRLRELAACDSSLKWAESQESPLAAWRTCKRGDWLLWIATALNVDRRLIVQAACSCARLALPHVPSDEDRPLKAIDTAERWADGLATIEEVRQAADAAYAATRASRSTYVAAADAAYAATRASRVAYAAAADAAYAAASDAAYAAADAAYAAASAACAADVGTAVLRQCADIVRSVISEDVMLAAWSDKHDAQGGYQE